MTWRSLVLAEYQLVDNLDMYMNHCALHYITLHYQSPSTHENIGNRRQLLLSIC